jgi:hypothetical protein
VGNLALPGLGFELSFRRQLEMIEVVNHLLDDLRVISVTKVVKVAFVGMGFEVENTRDRLLSIC